MPETIISQKKSFLDLNESELNEILTKTGEKKFRIKQINNWIYNQNVRSWDEMINLPISMIEYLKNKILLHPLKFVHVNGSENDKTRKYQLAFSPNLDVGTMWRCISFLYLKRNARTFSEY